jgi:hypothetical protein
MKRIAFLFLTIDDIHFPNLWTQYFHDHSDQINIYCHPKNPENVYTPWLKKNIIPNLTETGWGYIVNAYYELLKYAYKNEENIKFIIISESCVPLKNFNKMYDFILKDEKTSFIKYMKIKKYDWSDRIKNQENWNKLGIKFVKHYARFCLSRFHVKILLSKKKEIEFFSKMHVGDEFFLSILGTAPHIKDYMVTFDNWERVNVEINEINNALKTLYDNNGSKNKIQELTDLKNNIRKNPFTYTTVLKSDVLEAKNTNSFFWRKFSKQSNIRDFVKIKKLS